MPKMSKIATNKQQIRKMWPLQAEEVKLTRTVGNKGLHVAEHVSNGWKEGADHKERGANGMEWIPIAWDHKVNDSPYAYNLY